MVVAAPVGVGTCEFLRSHSSQHTPHICQFLQRTWLCRVGRTSPVRMDREFSPSRRDREGRCASYRALTCVDPPVAATMGKGFLGTPPPPSGELPPAGRLPAMRLASEALRMGPMYYLPSRSTIIGSREKGTLDPGASSTSEADASMHLLKY